ICADLDFHNLVLSMKSSNTRTMVFASRLLVSKMAQEGFDYPLHLGVTEAGTVETGSIKSAIGIGSLLLDGIGDTIRVSLTGDPVSEVSVAKNILRVLGMTDEVTVISCPTCGRTSIDIISIASSVEAKTKHIRKKLKVAVMGCEVNGPGEAADADIGIAAGKNSAVLFKQGKPVRKITENYVEELVREIELWKSE
ncbi:MAG: flavodoxin-dependent (E)-4-hydroxy-3-methylbut-2-enyl-diphosphate synthase, partial [Oscillospiraceae bacterium]|nr:flavodoxin-dependent (E)-4-hydroxy-3-methylbut-2-enyl-diphosphate synthase [Oscillospiraceae bacterium]